MVTACCVQYLRNMSRDSSAGRLSDRRSEGPWFDPGSRHFVSLQWQLLRILAAHRVAPSQSEVLLSGSCCPRSFFSPQRHGDVERASASAFGPESRPRSTVYSPRAPEGLCACFPSPWRKLRDLEVIRSNDHIAHLFQPSRCAPMGKTQQTYGGLWEKPSDPASFSARRGSYFPKPSATQRHQAG